MTPKQQQMEREYYVAVAETYRYDSLRLRTALDYLLAMSRAVAVDPSPSAVERMRAAIKAAEAARAESEDPCLL